MPYTDLRRDADGRVRVRLAGPGGRGVARWGDGRYPSLGGFTGDALACVRAASYRTGSRADDLRAGRALCVYLGAPTIGVGQGITLALASAMTVAALTRLGS